MYRNFLGRYTQPMSKPKAASPSSDRESILREIKAADSERVKLAVTDIDGVLRGKYVNKQKFFSAAESGFGFCNVVFGWDSADVVYDNNVEYTGWHTGYPDAQAQIDLNTYRRVPWDENVPFFLADFVDDKGAPLSVCPRQLLKRVIAKAQKLGFTPTYAMEFEWFNFAETPQSLADKGYRHPQPITPGMFGYSILRSSLNQPFMSDLMNQLKEFKIPLEGLHTETGPGVYEGAILYSDALEAADRATLFKTAVKEIAYRHQILPSFMAKWNSKLPGCGGHIHQSLWEKGHNVFYDAKDPQRMSDTFKSFLAGQMLCAPEITPFYAPNVNSYKRLVEGMWAPTRINWCAENRTASFRVIPGSEKSTRLETRIPGSDVNPYLAIAAALASGLYGIEKGLKLDTPMTRGNAYKDDKAKRIPSNLRDATERMNQSKIANELFGQTFIAHFARTREWEWRQFQESVTSWEMERYFELI